MTEYTPDNPEDVSQEEIDQKQGIVADSSLDAVKEGGPVEVEGGYQTRPLDTLTREEREEYVRTAAEAEKANQEAREKAEEERDEENDDDEYDEEDTEFGVGVDRADDTDTVTGSDDPDTTTKSWA